MAAGRKGGNTQFPTDSSALATVGEVDPARIDRKNLDAFAL